MQTAADILLRVPDWFVEIDETQGRERLAWLSRNGELNEACVELWEAFEADSFMSPDHRRSYRRVMYRSDLYSDDPDLVYKLPNTDDDGHDDNAIDGVWSNVYEAGGAAHDAYSGPIAACRIAWHESGVPVVVMERVTLYQFAHEAIRRTNPVPGWAREVDGQQIGWSDAAGAWVIYDAGCPPHGSHVEAPEWWGYPAQNVA
jgi:hypothetical protein